METKHTILPWRVLSVTEGPNKVPRIASAGGGIAILCVNRYLGEPGPSKQEVANAEFIVRACNSHDELLAALKAAERLLMQIYCDSECDRLTELREEHPSAWKLIDQMRAAIQKATT